MTLKAEAIDKLVCCGNLPCGGCLPQKYAQSTRHAQAITAYVREQLTSDEAVERACKAWWGQHTTNEDDMRAAILAAIGGE